MTVDNSTLKLNTIITGEYKKPETVVSTTTADDNWLLSLTSRFSKDALTNVERIMTSDDVISGDVNKEIDKILSEEEQINSIIKANTTTLNAETNKALSTTLRANTAKTIGFVQYTGGSKVNSKTDTTAIKNCIVASNTKERQLISDSIDLLVEWLDDYIVNHNVRVAEGLRRGDSELKQSFLLEIRKAIENFDFPIGFGTYDADSNTLGAYSSASVLNDGTPIGYDTTHLNIQRSLLLNPNFFMPERPYNSLAELDAALQAGGGIAYNGYEFLVDDEAFNNYCKNYLASTLFHEIVHSTHIYNEGVTYFSGDTFDDDWMNRNVEGVSQEVLNYVKQFQDMVVTMGDGKSVVISFQDGIQYKDLLISHYLNGFSDAVNHGYAMIQDNKAAFDILLPGFTKKDCENELKNFAITA